MKYRVDDKRVKEMCEKYSRIGKVEYVWMSPLRFLDKVPHPATTLASARFYLGPEYFDKGSVADITARIKAGKPLDPLLLDYTDIYHGWPTHEGRHRAYVAYKLGIDRVPVIIVSKNAT